MQQLALVGPIDSNNEVADLVIETIEDAEDINSLPIYSNSFTEIDHFEPPELDRDNPRDNLTLFGHIDQSDSDQELENDGSISTQTTRLPGWLTKIRSLRSRISETREESDIDYEDKAQWKVGTNTNERQSLSQAMAIDLDDDSDNEEGNSDLELLAVDIDDL